MTPTKAGRLKERFWKRVIFDDGCWNWAGTITDKGYGRMWTGGVGGRWIMAHRLSWELTNGPIPNGLFICHRCDNPRCVRPDHLFKGTNQDNVDDLSAKREAWLNGEIRPTVNNVTLPNR